MMVWLQATTTTFLWQMFLLFLSLFVKILSFIISLTTFGPRLIYNTTTKKWNKVCIETSLATECKKATIFIFGKTFIFLDYSFSRFHFKIIVTFSKLRRGVEQQQQQEQQHCIMIPQWTLQLGATPNHYVQFIQK